MKITSIILLFAFILSACGGTPADTPMPTLAAMPDASVTEQIAAPATEDAAAVEGNADLPQIDSSSLEAGAFQVEIVNNKGEQITLEPFVTDNAEARLLYITGGYSAMDFMEPPYRQIDFTRVTRDNPDSGMTSSDVKLQFPMDVQPGTYTINSIAPNLDDGNVYGAWISIFDGDCAIYEEYEGTITITAVDDETITGSFIIVGRGEDGYVSSASGAFNQLGKPQPIQ